MLNTIGLRLRHPQALWRHTGWLALAAGAWALSPGAAQARDVYWSVGVSGPGVVVGVGNVPQPRVVHHHAPAPVYVQPAPQVVYASPQVVYPAPQVVYGAPPVVYAPHQHGPAVVLAPAPVAYSAWGHGGLRWNDRYERRDARRHHREHSRDWHDDDRGRR
jgi:hypothetical protein